MEFESPPAGAFLLIKTDDDLFVRTIRSRRPTLRRLCVRPSPPLHFNCRSTVRPVYAEEAAAFGIKESAEVSFPDAPAKGFGQYPINTPSKSIQEKNLESPRKFLGENSQWDKVTYNLKKRYEKTQNTPVATDLVNELKKYPFFKSVPKELRDDFERDLLNVEVDQLKILVKYAKEMKDDFQQTLLPKKFLKIDF